MKKIFIIAGSFMQYRHCKAKLMKELLADAGDFRYLTEASQIAGLHDFTLLKTGEWYKSDELVKLVDYAEAILEATEATREAEEAEALLDEELEREEADRNRREQFEREK